jgi:hypothetical protein
VGILIIFVAGLLAGQTMTRNSPTATPGTTLTVSGPIIDAKTGATVTADVYVDNRLMQDDVDRIEVVVLLRADRPIEIWVAATGYQPWALAIRGGGTDKRMEGPVPMVPVETKGQAPSVSAQTTIGRLLWVSLKISRPFVTAWPSPGGTALPLAVGKSQNA